MAKAYESKPHKKWNYQDICDWCVDNNQVDWLIATLEKKVKHDVYPTYETKSKNGRKIKKADKTAAALGVEEKDITYMELKVAFDNKFFPAPKKEAKKSMLELARELKR